MQSLRVLLAFLGLALLAACEPAFSLPGAAADTAVHDTGGSDGGGYGY